MVRSISEVLELAVASASGRLREAHVDLVLVWRIDRMRSLLEAAQTLERLRGWGGDSALPGALYRHH